MKQDNATLVVVDDNELNRDLLARRLGREGYSVLTASNGSSALEILANRPADLVLLDVDMPEMDGFEVLRQLRQTHSAAELPVIMVTAMSTSDNVVRALGMGASDYVTKPLDYPVALARIRTQLQRKRAEEALRESEERYALAARGANDGLWDYDLRRGEVYLSPRWKSMLGWEDGELGNAPAEWFGRVHPEDAALVESELKSHLDGVTPHFEAEYRIRHRDGSYRWMLGRGIAVRDPNGKAYRIAGSQTDITRGKIADALTGLPNRILFIDQLNRCLERSRRHLDYFFAVLFLDLDGFKLINESLGHFAGDQVLVETAHRLETSLRGVDVIARIGAGFTVARLGGDEFTILLDNIRTPLDATSVAERIIDEMAKAILVHGQEIFTTVSMGITLSGPSYERPEELLRDADTAMYRAKLRGKACYEIFDAEMRATSVARLQTETDLRRALERDQLMVYYQPVVNLSTGRICSFEGLLRWKHPTRGIVSPANFIPVAEETGLIIPMEEWALKEASGQMALWRGRWDRPEPLRLSVNLSSRHFVQHDLVERYRSILAESKLDPHCVNLEVTESTVVAHPGLATEIMNELKALGIRMSMDDFGTGYSSLSYLQRFPFDTLKIDRSFVSRMKSCDESEEIVRTIVTLAHNLSLQVVAEGIETLHQLKFLKSLGCEYGQGAHISMPVPADQAERMIEEDHCWE
jgi:diguanylate cyclase (GGDEF)-like protein/PAS domain S-box-containing protein